MVELTWFYLAFISAILSAAAAIFEKKSLFRIDALEFSTILSFFTLIFSVPFLFFFDLAKITMPALLVLFVKTIFNSLAFYFVMSALKRLDISNSLPLMNLSPALVAIFALIFLNEFLSILQIAGLLLLIIGTYILNLKARAKFFDPFIIFFRSKSHHFIIFAILAFTFTSILDKVLVGNFKMPPEAFMFFQHLFTFVLFVLFLFILRKKKAVNLLKRSWKASALFIAIVGVLTIGYRYTQIMAVKIGKVALVLAVKRFSVFFASVIGGSIFHENDLFRRILAIVILIAGTIMITSL